MKLLLVFAAMAVIAAFAVAGLAIANERANTIVTIHGQNGDYHGTILSKRGGCLGDRTVKVFKQKGAGQNPKRDTVIGKDISERNGDHGVWSIGNSGFKHGKFYAKALRTDACRGNYSKTISR
jgi:hypothetical protein